jgi:hypothetical protein
VSAEPPILTPEIYSSHQTQVRTSKIDKCFFFFLCMFLGNQRFFFVIFSSVAPHRGQPAAKCHPCVATHQEIGSQLWAGETPDSNPGLQDNSLVLPLSYHASLNRQMYRYISVEVYMDNLFKATVSKDLSLISIEQLMLFPVHMKSNDFF